MAAIRENLEHRIHPSPNSSGRPEVTGIHTRRFSGSGEEADRKFGHRTPEEVLNELDELRTERDELRTMLAERPDADAAARPHGSRERAGRVAGRAHRTCAGRCPRLKRRLAYADNDVTEREVLRDCVTSLESQRQLLHKAHEQIRSEIDDLLSRTEARSPFPACTAMDEDSALQCVGVDVRGTLETSRNSSRICSTGSHPIRNPANPCITRPPICAASSAASP